MCSAILLFHIHQQWRRPARSPGSARILPRSVRCCFRSRDNAPSFAQYLPHTRDDHPEIPNHHCRPDRHCHSLGAICGCRGEKTQPGIAGIWVRSHPAKDRRQTSVPLRTLAATAPRLNQSSPIGAKTWFRPPASGGPSRGPQAQPQRQFSRCTGSVPSRTVRSFSA
jgi:hypothetical protein